MVAYNITYEVVCIKERRGRKQKSKLNLIKPLHLIINFQEIHGTQEYVKQQGNTISKIQSVGKSTEQIM